jgi:hypothetical protein
MLDPSRMYPEGFHPVKMDRSRDFKGCAKRHTRTQRPARYYLIDFGLSRRYDSRDALDEPLRGGDKSAPEHQHRRACNPFHTDIYYLGNLVREHFINVVVPRDARRLPGLTKIFQKYNGFEFMKELVDAMTVGEPEKRPVIEDVIERFTRVRDSLSGFKLRSPVTSRKDVGPIIAFRYVQQTIRTLKYILCQTPAIPDVSHVYHWHRYHI